MSKLSGEGEKLCGENLWQNTIFFSLWYDALKNNVGSTAFSAPDSYRTSDDVILVYGSVRGRRPIVCTPQCIFIVQIPISRGCKPRP